VPKLKVYRTPIGFHDAYVAAPSQKAALKAWGSDADLFARGVAEVVDDPALTAEPLARPGEVVRRLRGSAAEQFAALPPDRPKAAAKKKAAAKRAAKPKPRPDRGALDAAERALADAGKRQRDEDAVLAAEERALAERRRLLRATHEAETATLEQVREEAERAFDRTMERWRDA
jgi:hypothetical protein